MKTKKVLLDRMIIPYITFHIIFFSATTLFAQMQIKGGRISFKKASLTIKKNGEILELKNGYIDLDKLLITNDKKASITTYQISDLTKLIYSQHNLAFIGSIVGLTTGALITKAIIENNNKTHYTGPFEIRFAWNWTGIFIIPVTLTAGYVTGSHIYYNWQDYDLSGIKKADKSIKPSLYFTRDGIRVELSFPIR